MWKWKSLSCVQLFVTHGLYSPCNSPGQKTGVGSLSLLQEIFPTQGSNSGFPHCRRDSLPEFFSIDYNFHLGSQGQLLKIPKIKNREACRGWRAAGRESHSLFLGTGSASFWGWVTSSLNSWSWWWTGRPGCCDSWGRKESDTTERLNWTELTAKARQRF